MLKEQIDSLLDRVQKPARYMGGEMNCVLKDPNSVDIRYAFAFPDVYEVGMSHLGNFRNAFREEFGVNPSEFRG